MKIATKVFSGYGILIAIMAAMLAYQVGSIYRLESTVRNLSSVDFRSGRLSLELMRSRDLVEEYCRKSFALGDPDYANQFEEFKDSFERTLAELRPVVRSRREANEIDRLLQIWVAFLQDLSKTGAEKASDKWIDNLPDGLANYFNQLRTQCLAVHMATLAGIDAEVENARRTGRRAEIVSWSAAGIALLLSCVVSFLIVRSISKPLRQLIAGTRAIAEGRFFYRLSVSRHDEFADLARDFNTMTTRLNELDTLKKDFVSHVSHELKTPLASIQETIRILLEQIPGPLTDKQKRFLELNLQSARRLSAMIANLLDLSRIDAGTMIYDIKRHSLRDLIQTTVSENEPKAVERNLRIDVSQPDGLLTVDCDLDRMIQVLENILGNAIKFSSDSGTIEVRAAAVNQIPASIPDCWRARFSVGGNRGIYYLITIADHGPGVADDHKEKIFEKFHQMRSAKMKGQGAGLGLAISRTIIKAHGGAVWVEDNAGGGSRFIVLLPSEATGRYPRPESRPI